MKWSGLAIVALARCSWRWIRQEVERFGGDQASEDGDGGRGDCE